MAANTTPIFAARELVQWSTTITAANTTKDGTTGTLVQLYSNPGADYEKVVRILGKAKGTNVITVARLFLNNGGVTTTATNNTYIGDIDLPSTTISETATFSTVDRPFNIPIPPGYVLYIVLATAVAAGWQFTAVGADFGV